MKALRNFNGHCRTARSFAEMNAPAPHPRWFHLTPGRLLVGLLVIEGLLFVFSGWFPKGYAVLLALVAVGVAMSAMLVWFLIALIFRLRFQYSLRSLLVLTLAIALPCSWLAVEMKKATEQRETVEWISKGSGSVRYANEWLSGAEPKGPVWLRNLLGDDFFNDVFLARVNGDAQMAHLARLTHLRVLWLQETKVTDAGLAHLAGLTQLKCLFLEHTKVTDAGVKKLQQALPNCQINR